MRLGLWTVLAVTVLVTGPVVAAEQLAGLPPSEIATWPRGDAAATPALVAAVTDLRVMRQGAHTQVSLDLTGPAPASWRVTPSGRSVLLNFPSIHWEVPASGRRTGGLVSKYLFGAGENGGGDLALIVAEPVRVGQVRSLPPAAKGGRYQLVVDLIPRKALADAGPQATAQPDPAAAFGTTTVRLAR
ncbi:MAG: hypothetical protein H7841_06290 [Magnetospirillum sp. WYHS-4]